jgi:hypothetical protein
LDTDELERRTDAAILQAKFNHLSNALHESVEVLGLSMATSQDRNGGDVIAVFILFDDHCELSLGFHKTILPPAFRRDAACRVSRLRSETGQTPYLR